MDSQPRTSLKSAAQYVARVDSLYRNRPDVYKRFLDLMTEFRERTMDTAGVIHGIKQLFGDQSALLTDFDQFLPPGWSVLGPEKPPTTNTLAAQRAIAASEDDGDDEVMITGMQASTSAPVLWHCSTCSYLNDRSATGTRCEMCLTVEVRPTFVPPVRPPAAVPGPALVAVSSVITSASSATDAAVAASKPSSTSPVDSNSISTSSSPSSSSSSTSPSPSTSSLSSVLNNITNQSSAPAKVSHREADVASETEPPPSFRTTLSSLEAAEAAIVALRQQLSQSHWLASPSPAVPAGDEQRTLASVRQLCSELTNQLAASAHLRLACRSVAETVNIAKVHVDGIVQLQGDRNALLLTTLAQLTRTSSSTQEIASIADGLAAVDGGRLQTEKVSDNVESVAKDEQLAEQPDCPDCPICLDELCNALVQPCCHVSCCLECAKQLKKKKKSCPRCHTKIRSVIAVKR